MGKRQNSQQQKCKWPREKKSSAWLIRNQRNVNEIEIQLSYDRHSFKNYESAGEVGEEAPANVAGGRVSVMLSMTIWNNSKCLTSAYPLHSVILLLEIFPRKYREIQTKTYVQRWSSHCYF